MEKIRFSYSEPLAFTCQLNGEIPLWSDVRISGDGRVLSIAGNGHYRLGVLSSIPQGVPGKVTVSTKHQGEFHVKISGTIAPGDLAKLADPLDGVPRYAKWIPGTDNPNLVVAYCLNGGADGETGVFAR